MLGIGVLHPFHQPWMRPVQGNGCLHVPRPGERSFINSMRVPVPRPPSPRVIECYGAGLEFHEVGVNTCSSPREHNGV